MQAGDQIGSYRVIDQIALGGSSAVYKAKDALLDRDVAIKQLIIEDHADPEGVVQRGRSEGMLQKLAAHDQPRHLVQLIDIIDDHRGLMLITELVEGHSLEEQLAEEPGPMAERRALAIIAATAKGLHAIHSKKIVHRDLKPANILMSDEDQTLKVSDFGLATILGHEDQIMEGTARYLAPEVWRGEPATPKSDLYALGMLAYELLIGRAKFDQAFKTIVRDERNRDLRWMKWHTNARTKAPGVRTLNPDVSEQIESLIEDLMGKEPENRPASAKEVVRRIKRYVSGDDDQVDTLSDSATTGDTTSPGDTAPLPIRSHGKLVTRILIATLALQLGVAAYLIAGKIRADNDKAEARRREAITLANQAREALDQKRWDEALSKYEKLGARFDAMQGVTQHAEAGILWAKAELAMQRQDYDNAHKLFIAAIETDKWQGADRNYLSDRQVLANDKQTYQLALADINDSISRGDLTTAKGKINEWRNLVSTDEQRAELQGLAVKLHGQQSEAGLARELARARERIELDRPDQAIEILQAALREADQRGMAGFTVSQMQAELKRLISQKEYQAALSLAQQAEEAGDLAAAIEAYKNVKSLSDSPDIRDRLARLESLLFFDQGKAALEGGDVDLAERLLTAALGKNPDNGAARELLATIGNAERKFAFIAAGKDALAAGDYDLAIKQFQNALQFGSDQSISDEINRARVRLSHQLGLKALANGELNRARDLFERALSLAPEDAATNAALGNLNTQAAYLQKLEEGDNALTRSDFRDALRFYRAAQKVKGTDEIRQRINDAEYAQMVAQARALIDAEQYRAAQGSLRTALAIKDTQEVRDLLQQIEEKAPRIDTP